MFSKVIKELIEKIESLPHCISQFNESTYDNDGFSAEMILIELLNDIMIENNLRGDYFTPYTNAKIRCEVMAKLNPQWGASYYATDKELCINERIN